MKDIYGNEYELYSGKIYVSKGKQYGNVVALIPKSDNNRLHIIYYGEITKEQIENAIVAMGWKVEDWL